MLFLLHLISKMRDVDPDHEETRGRAAIVLNGSPLFTGKAGSGESEIRRWVIESDLLDAIIALPTEMFYNTGIATYIWVLDRKKPVERRGTVQLIDGSAMFVKMRKSLGSKRKELSAEDIETLVKLYAAFGEVMRARFRGWRVALLAAARFLPHGPNDLILRLIGLTSIAYVPLDIFSDTLARPGAQSDASMLAHEFGGPTVFWGGLWLALSLAAIAFALYRTLRLRPSG